MRYIVLIAILFFAGCSIKDIEKRPDNYSLSQKIFYM